MATALTSGKSVRLLSAVTTGTSEAVIVPTGFKNLRFNVSGTGTISGGTIILEEASNPAYSGTWSLLTTITASELSGGATKNLHVFGMFQAVRARIGTDISGSDGNITVEVISA